MLAERRDFTVATYSSTRGTGARVIVSVLTGSDCGAGCFASVLLHPELPKTAKAINTANSVIASFFNFSIGVSSNGFSEVQMSVAGRGIQLCIGQNEKLTRGLADNRCSQ